jgi:hypothetical protein
MQMAKKILKTMIPLAVVITLFSGIVYTVQQQTLRMNANDPQIQIAEDAAAALTRGQAADAVVPSAKVDIAQSLAPYIVLFDDSGQAIASSGLLHDQYPALPTGVFDYVRNSGEDRITWQPEPGVRGATVVTRYGGAHPGFVLAGRSLRLVEERVDQLGLIVGLGWLGTLFAALVAVSMSEIVLGREGPLLRTIPLFGKTSEVQKPKTSQTVLTPASQKTRR